MVNCTASHLSPLISSLLYHIALLGDFPTYLRPFAFLSFWNVLLLIYTWLPPSPPSGIYSMDTFLERLPLSSLLRITFVPKPPCCLILLLSTYYDMLWLTHFVDGLSSPVEGQLRTVSFVCSDYCYFPSTDVLSRHIAGVQRLFLG